MAIYKLGESVSSDKVKSPVYATSLIHAKKLKDYIIKNKFDIVVCTHLFGMQTITYLQNKGLKIKSYGVITDYTYIPFIEETNLDKYFIAHKSLINDFARKGMKKINLIPTGIPVKSIFQKEVSIEDAKKELNIKTNKPIILIMMGGLGCGNAIGICKNILKNEDIYVIVLAGKNKKLIKELKRKFNNSNFEVISFTNQVHLYLSAASIVISKPDGISSTETAIKNKPLIHFNSYLAVENYNRKFFNKFHLSVYSKKISDLDKIIRHILKKKKHPKQKIINPKATEDIVDYILKR